MSTLKTSDCQKGEHGCSRSDKPAFTDRLRQLGRTLAAPIGAVALCLAAIRPWFRLEAVCSDDFAFHLLRLVQLDALVRRGVLYSRWAPDMALGYGYPFFNFYAPLSYYVADALSLVGLGLQHALIATFALATLAAGLAAYLLARDHFSRRSALIAAVAYAYAPYLAYDAYFRGNLAETVAWVFLPLALWAMGRLARRGDRRYVAATALAYAAVLLTHNVFALIFSPLLAAYGLATAFALPPAQSCRQDGGGPAGSKSTDAGPTSADASSMSAPSRRRHLALTCAALLLGMGLAAFFWLPALVERAYVHSDRLLVPPIFVYWNNFIRPSELLAGPRVVHPDLLNPSPPRALGLIPVLMGLPALIGLWRFRDRPRRLQVAFFAATLVGYAWLTMPSSRVVWDSLPLLEYVQFPWRLLGPAALCLAMLVAAAAELLPRGWRGSVPLAVAIALIAGGALFWLEPRYCPDMGSPTAADIAHFEQITHTVGTTAKGEYLPRTVAAIPEEPPIAALDPSSVPSGTTITRHYRRAVGAELVIEAPQPFTAVYNGFDYPGWRVSVDGAAVPVTPDEPYGRITFPVPEGQHRVSIRFGETPLRRAADWASLACLILVAGSLLWPVARPGNRRVAAFGPPTVDGRPVSWAWAAWGLAILGTAMLLQHASTPLRRPGLQGDTLPNLDVAMNVPFEGGLTLLGFNQEQATVPSGDDLVLDLFWTPWEPPAGHYSRAIVLIGPAGLRWNPKDTLPPRSFREPPATYAWPVGSYVQDTHRVETEPGTPPGVYELSLAVFERETLTALRVLEADGRPGQPALTMGTITVTRPERSPDPAKIATQYPVKADLGPLTLLGFDLDRTEAAPGDPFTLSLFWLANGSLEREPDLSVRLGLRAAGSAPDSAPALTFDLPPTNEPHPTSTWQAGDVWRGQHSQYLPASLEDGDYTWRITLLPTGQSIDLPPGLHVTAPVHDFAAPPVDVAADARLTRADGAGDIATLVGARLEPATGDLAPGTPLTVTLVWRAEAETHTSYRVFLHLTAPGGALVAQSDGIPAGWTRPTTGWLPGEYVLDRHVLNVPPDAQAGTYTLAAGLYDATGARLIRAAGSDTVPLGTVMVQGMQ